MSQNKMLESLKKLQDKLNSMTDKEIFDMLHGIEVSEEDAKMYAILEKALTKGSDDVS